mgnify:CR=1 FL=1
MILRDRYPDKHIMKITGSIKLKDSSCFYQMYEDKVFDSLKITINQNIFQNFSR